MIVFDLSCPEGHVFEGWFASSDDFARQQAKGMVTCPRCGSGEVAKAPMAPAVPKKGNQQPVSQETRGSRHLSNKALPAPVAEALRELAKAQALALQDSTFVGRDFAEQSRAMHYGEREFAPIHGEASLAEAHELIEEGVPIAPLPLPVAPADKLN